MLQVVAKERQVLLCLGFHLQNESAHGRCPSCW